MDGSSAVVILRLQRRLDCPNICGVYSYYGFPIRDLTLMDGGESSGIL